MRRLYHSMQLVHTRSNDLPDFGHRFEAISPFVDGFGIELLGGDTGSELLSAVTLRAGEGHQILSYDTCGLCLPPKARH